MNILRQTIQNKNISESNLLNQTEHFKQKKTKYSEHRKPNQTKYFISNQNCPAWNQTKANLSKPNVNFYNKNRQLRTFSLVHFHKAKQIFPSLLYLYIYISYIPAVGIINYIRRRKVSRRKSFKEQIAEFKFSLSSLNI